MGDIVELKERVLSPLASILNRLVRTCRHLVARHPYDPRLQEVRNLIEEYDAQLEKEINRK